MFHPPPITRILTLLLAALLLSACEEAPPPAPVETAPETPAADTAVPERMESQPATPALPAQVQAQEPEPEPVLPLRLQLDRPLEEAPSGTPFGQAPEPDWLKQDNGMPDKTAAEPVLPELFGKKDGRKGVSMEGELMMDNTNSGDTLPLVEGAGVTIKYQTR